MQKANCKVAILVQTKEEKMTGKLLISVEKSKEDLTEAALEPHAACFKYQL